MQDISFCIMHKNKEQMNGKKKKNVMQIFINDFNILTARNEQLYAELVFSLQCRTVSWPSSFFTLTIPIQWYFIKQKTSASGHWFGGILNDPFFFLRENQQHMGCEVSMKTETIMRNKKCIFALQKICHNYSAKTKRKGMLTISCFHLRPKKMFQKKSIKGQRLPLLPYFC